MSASSKQPSKSARNATRHGLSSMKHLPAGREHELAPIVRELMAVRQPQTPHQEYIVRQMALSIWQCTQRDKNLYQAEASYREQAGARFDKQAEADFIEIRNNWLTSPAQHMDKMAESPLGVKYIIEHLAAAAGCIMSNSPLSLPMTRHMIRCEGLSTSLQWLQGEGELILRHALALTGDPRAFMEEWLGFEKETESATCVSRAREVLQNIPDAAFARGQLQKRAENRLQYWRERLPVCQAAHEQARIKAITFNSGFASFDDKQMKQMQLLQRYSTAAQNRLKELNKEYNRISGLLIKERWRTEDREMKQTNLSTDRLLRIAALSPESRRWFDEQSLLEAERKQALARLAIEQPIVISFEDAEQGTDGNWYRRGLVPPHLAQPHPAYESGNEIPVEEIIDDIFIEPIKLVAWSLPILEKDPEPLRVVKPPPVQATEVHIQQKNLRNLEKMLPRQEKPPEPVVIAEYEMEIPANWREEEEKVKHLKPHVKMYEHLTLEDIKGMGEFVKHIRMIYPERTKWLDRIEYYYKVELGERGLAPRR